MKKEIFLIVFLFLLNLSFANAAEFDRVISNSEKWTDVYSAVHFANLKGAQGDFLVSTGHGTIILSEINQGEKIIVATSEDRPYVFNYPSLIDSKGFSDTSEIVGKDLNLELIEELPEIDNFVVVSDSFGYNALAVAPYAVQTKSWVFLVNRENVFEIDSILSTRDIDKILIYGFVDALVLDTLSKYNPEIINTGDRFEDNIEIAKKFLEIKPMKQVVLTNGEFIEKEIMAGTEAVLFTGKENVPDQIRDYLKTSGIEVGVLIGNDLVGAATNIRRSTGISVMVKFARNARSPEGGIAQVEGLDLFPVPAPKMQLLLHSVKYNRALSQLEVTYKSESNIPTYFKGTITLDSNGERVKVGDLDPIFIAPGNYKTAIYSINSSFAGNLRAEIYTLYGETVSSLERILSQTVDVEIIDVIDACSFTEENIRSVKYNKQKESIFVNVKNTKDSDCWVYLEIEGLKIGYSSKDIGAESAVRIPAGKSKKIPLKQELTEKDLENNRYVTLNVYSGEREDSLVHTLKGKFELRVEALTLLTYAIIALAIMIVLLIIILVILKKKQEEYY